MPIAHPARILRGGWNLQESQTHYLGRLFELARSGDAPYMPNIYEPPPNTILYPTLSDLHEFRLEADRLGAVALDIETAGSHIVCVGCTAMAPDGLVITNTIVLRFRIQGGNIYWSDWKKHVAAVEWLYDLLSSPLVKVFQNGITFDVPELVELGFDVQGPFIDTMHLSYSADVERPKGLQYMSTLFLGMPVWKTLTDGEELEGKD